MKLEYVGAMPMVSSRGVGFDQSRPDKYTFLNATIELLEALDFGPTETTQHLYNTQGKEYKSDEILELLKKYCPNIDEVFSTQNEKAKELIEDLKDRVNNNKTITEEERNTWLNNIRMMSDYYLQHVTNEGAYKAALDALGQEVHDAEIKEVNFPMFRNYGMVLHDLIKVLEHRRPPIDAELTLYKKDGDFFGKLTVSHNK